MKLLECENVSFAYDGKYVLKNVNFCLNQKDYLAIVGENGSGKSTLIKGLLSLKAPAKGTIRRWNMEKDEIGYLPQKQTIQRDFPASVMEVVLSGRIASLKSKWTYGKKDKEIAWEGLETMSMDHLAKKSYQELSGGQQQRVLLARALCSGKKMIVLDEPVTGLDPLATGELYQTIARLNREKNITVVMVSHNINDAILYSNKIRRYWG